MVLNIIIAAVAIAARHRFYVGLVQDRANQTLVDVRCGMQSMLDDVYFCPSLSTTRTKQSMKDDDARTSTRGASGGRSTMM